MKVTFEFWHSLKTLLESSDWQSNLVARVKEIDRELATTPSEQFQTITKSWKKQQRSEVIEKLKKSLHTSYEKLQQEKIEIGVCLESQTYRLGVKPFDNIDNAKLLLANVHILELPNKGFHQAPVAAIQRMLRENFKQLYDKDVSSLEKTNNILTSEQSNQNLLNKIINSEILTTKDFIGHEEVTPADMSYIHKIIEVIKCLDPKLVAQTAPIIEFISHFYPHGVTDIASLTINLTIYFNNIEDINNYLSKIDYTSPQSIEADLQVLTPENFALASLTMEERNIWHKINAKFGKQAIKLFAQGVDIKKIFNIVEFFKENDNNLPKVFEKLQAVSKLIRFTNEDLEPKLGELCHKYHQPNSIFDRIIKEILPNAKKSDDLPDIKFDLNIGKEQFYFQKLPAGDLQGLFLGLMTACCQFIGGHSEKCVIDGFTREDAGFYIITDSEGKVKAQSYAFIGQNTEGKDILVLDSFEHLPEAKKIFLDASLNLAKLVKAYGFLDLYIGSGGKTPRLDITTEKVTPKDSSLYQYHDSHSAYKITPDIKLLEDAAKELVPFESFEDYVAQNKIIMWNKLEAENHDLLDELNSSNHPHARYQLTQYIEVVYALINKYGVKFASIIPVLQSFYRKEEGRDVFYTTHFLMNNDPSVLDAKLKIVSRIFEIYQDKPEVVGKFLLKLPNDINPVIIKALSPDLFIKVVENCEYLPQIFIHPLAVGTDISLNILQNLLTKYNDDFSKTEKILNFFGNLHQDIFDVVDTDYLISIHEENSGKALLLILQKYTYNPGHNISKETRQKVIGTIIKKFKTDVKSALKVLEKFSYLHSSVIEQIDIEQFLKVFEKDGCSPPSILAWYTGIDIEVRLKAINIILNKYKDDFEEGYKLFEKLSQLDDAIINHIDIEQLIAVAEKSNWTPSVLRAYTKLKVDPEAKVSIVSKILEEHKDNINMAIDALENFSDLNVVYDYPVTSNVVENGLLGDNNNYD